MKAFVPLLLCLGLTLPACSRDDRAETRSSVDRETASTVNREAAAAPSSSHDVRDGRAFPASFEGRSTGDLNGTPSHSGPGQLPDSAFQSGPRSQMDMARSIVDEMTRSLAAISTRPHSAAEGVRRQLADLQGKIEAARQLPVPEAAADDLAGQKRATAWAAFLERADSFVHAMRQNMMDAAGPSPEAIGQMEEQLRQATDFCGRLNGSPRASAD